MCRGSVRPIGASGGAAVGGRRERGGGDPDGVAESNDADGAALDHRAERRHVHAQPPGGLAYREEQ
jgi:hypothetical protein